LNTTFTKEWKVQIHVQGTYIDTKGLSRGIGYVVSDGLYWEDARLATWIIEGNDSAKCLIGNMHTPGYGADHSAFWSEEVVLTIIALQTEGDPHLPLVSM